MTASRVLFVDDDRVVLHDLKEALQTHRGEMQAHFVDGAPLALDMLDTLPFDAVVADARMSEMDGLTFLRIVRERYPAAIRFILVGNGDHFDAMQATGLSHQVVGKPVDADGLLGLLQRSMTLRRTLRRDDLVRLVTGATTIPSLPELYWEITEELASDGASPARAEEIIGSDPGMTLKVLQLVNSSFFGLRREITDVHQAVVLLGLDAIVTLALTVHVFSYAPRYGEIGQAMEDLWTHAFRVAGTAQAVARTEGCTPNETEECRLAALLHDCGKILLAANWPERALPVLTAGTPDSASLERREFGATSAEVGAYLVGLWGLPDPIVEAVAFHRSPSLASGRAFTPLTATHVAHIFEMPDGPGEFDMRYLEEAELTHRFPVWQTAHGDAVYERENV